MLAGYEYTTYHDFQGDCNDDSASRGAVYFDVSSLRGKTIVSAGLNLTVDSSTVGTDYHTDHFTSCAARLGTGQASWWNYTDWIDGGVVLQPGESQGPNVAYNVTQIVQSWASGTPNFGIVLFGAEENFNAFTEKSCMTTYVSGSVGLEVKFY